MKKLVSIALLLFASFLMAAAQHRAADYASSLKTVESQSGAKAVVTLDGASSSAIAATSSAVDKISGIRVTIFFDNSQNARSAAATTVEQVRKLFPDVPVYMTYSSPFFKVQAGDCLDRTEAAALLGRLKTIFPKATIVNEQISLSNFVKSASELSSTESLDPTL